MSWLSENPARLAAYRRGQRAVLSQVYQHYALELATRLRKSRIANSTPTYELDDIVQESFIRAFSSTARASYDGKRPFSSYLYSIARNIFIDRARSTQRHRAALDAPHKSGIPLHREDLDTNPKSPEAIAIDQEIARVYQDFIGSLEDVDRRLIRLRYEQELPRRTVSKETGLSPMQIRTRERRLRDNLYERLSQIGYAQKGQLLVGVAALLWLGA